MPVTEADLQSAQLGFRADLDGPLCVIAVAGWRTYLQEETTALPMQLWLAQMILNFLWSPIFFTLHNMAFALAVILTLLAVIVGFIWVRWRETVLRPYCLFPTRPGSPLHHSSIIPSTA